jgi:hypothetical protein
MSRSRRKTPITGITTANSEKWWKRKSNRRWRRAVKMALRKGKEILPKRKETGDSSWGPKDGKVYLGTDVDDKWMRK